MRSAPSFPLAGKVSPLATDGVVEESSIAQEAPPFFLANMAYSSPPPSVSYADTCPARRKDGAQFTDREVSMPTQTIKTASGEELVVLTRREFGALMAQLGDEEAEDRMRLLIAAKARDEAPLPAAISEAVLKGGSLNPATQFCVRSW